MPNHLHYGDNLTVLRDSIATESVDLIYLDPPFNSNAGYNVLFKAPDGSGSAAQIEAFDDTWHWNDSAEAAFADVLRSGNAAAADKSYVEIAGDHFGFRDEGQREGGILDAAAAIVDWLKARFPAAG